MAHPGPPRPARRAQSFVEHDVTRHDDYHWLRGRDDPEVLEHLRAENAHTDAVLAHLAPLRERLFDELRAHVQEADESAPVPDGPWEYFSRTVAGAQYGIQCRRPRGGGETAVVLDGNVEARGHDYFVLADLAVSPDHRRVAWAADLTGAEHLEIRVRDLQAGDDIDHISGAYYGLAWAADSETLFFTRSDAAHRPFQVWRHRVGTSADSDVCVFEEPDERFFVDVDASRSGDLVFIRAHSKSTSEVWTVDAHAPHEPPRVVQPRIAGVEYEVDHHRSASSGDRLFVLTNDGAEDFRVVVAPLETPSREHWVDVVAGRAGTRVESIDVYASHLVISERHEVDVRLRLIDLDDASAGAGRVVASGAAATSLFAGTTAEFDTATVRAVETSMVEPPADLDIDLRTGARTVVKRQPVPGYARDDHVTTRDWAVAADGTRIPITLVARREVLEGASAAPLLLTGYGAYESSYDPTFRASRLPLLARGFIVAIAHVRGGGELGRAWYEAGRLAQKRNTFTDFVACAQHLCDRGVTTPDRLVARGRSAGGLLMGAITNLRPDLFAAVVAEVPFVDAITTMSDPSLPLTVTEWEEWGDPRDPALHAAMLEYSPYDNVRSAPYPRVLATAGLNDMRVQYWEPAKWVARLRDHSTSDRPILLRTELGAGHGGPSGRYDAWREEAFVLAVICDAVGISA
ncbi:MAG TPA: S9 family peptidase [Acidimicrobiia bacterium]|nr:S9 family peptidase [Acidimicrobiia bacterium]